MIIPSQLRAAHWRGFDAAMTSGKSKLDGKPTLTRAMHKSGRKLYVEMSFAVVKDQNSSSVLGTVAVARDATQYVEAQRTILRDA